MCNGDCAQGRLCDCADKAWLSERAPMTSTDWLAAVAMAAAVFVPVAVWYVGAV